jgi:hypothetical protein
MQPHRAGIDLHLEDSLFQSECALEALHFENSNVSWQWQ